MQRQVNLTLRLIPTCVGSTAPRANQQACRTAHPHVCGEHGIITEETAREYGSSPRVWGAQAYFIDSILPVRLIPTCVGSTG